MKNTIIEITLQDAIDYMETAGLLKIGDLVSHTENLEKNPYCKYDLDIDPKKLQGLTKKMTGIIKDNGYTIKYSGEVVK